VPREFIIKIKVFSMLKCFEINTQQKIMNSK
jgi:hypothetical protein